LLLLAASSETAQAFTLRPSPTTSTFVPKQHHGLIIGSSSMKRKSKIQQQRQHNAKHHTVASASITMFSETSGGMEELQEMASNPEKANAATKLFRKNPSFWKLAGYASIPVSAALGFGLVPSRRISAHAIGALASGIAGAVGKSKLDAAMVDHCSKPAIAEALLEAADGGYLKNPKETAAKVKEVQMDYGILDEDFEILCTDIYTNFLLGMVKFQFQPKTSELKELEAIKVALSLDNLQVGEAHANAAEELFRTISLTTSEDDLDDPENTDRMAIDKYLFLTERSLRQGGETAEAFVFEMTRVAKKLKLDYRTALERVGEVVEPFYQRALKSTREKLDSEQVSSGMLERARKTLGVSDATAKDLHVACLNEEVRALLGKPSNTEDEVGEAKATKEASGGNFPEGSMQRVRPDIDLSMD